MAEHPRMKRPLHVWSAFAFCAAVLLGTMTWVTATAARLQSAQADAQREARFEEKVRLALWRMDSLLAPLIVRESSWPYFAYSAFYPAERAYNRMFHELQPGEILVPSPLLGRGATNVLLHFQLGPDGRLTSPEVSEAAPPVAVKSPEPGDPSLATHRARLADLRSLVTPEALLAACPPASGNHDASWVTQTPAVMNAANLAGLPASRPEAAGQQAQAAQVLQNNVELQARAQSYRQAIGNYGPVRKGAARPNVSEGVMKPIWLGDALLLARRVSVDGRDYVQGCWLDWPGLERGLLESTRDLLPHARLEALRGPSTNQDARLLASIPAKLVPGLAGGPVDSPASPLRFALLAAWACMLLALGAVGVLLYGTLSLSERRGAFVSAVTHEMRTPLTTFKMYSEMLAAGMVRDEEKRKDYLNTLCAEANRLSHLVENVLAYARLERGSARERVERVKLGELIERVRLRLQERAARSEMQLVIDAEEDALATVVHVDVAAVEQILFNLVDNACKYGSAGATERVIHLEALPGEKFAMLRVRDHGQGISADSARRLFKPFSKSAHEAAHSAPGIGLGLALCRRLSRSIGGDLRLTRASEPGACFELRLPRGGTPAALSSI